MAPSETAILEQFLLAPAQLPAALSLADFAALFPRSLQGSPRVRTLYRDLQRRRAAVVDAVAADIDAEVARGRVIRRHTLRARLRAAAQEDAAADDELQLERFVQGGERAEKSTTPHTLASIVAELEAAAADLEADIQQLDEEEDRLKQSVQQAVGGLSDLRYGRLANGQLRTQVLEGLQNVQATCEAVARANAESTTTT